MWHRGHPEERLLPSQYDLHDKVSVRCDELAELQYTGWSADVIRLHWWEFPHKPKWSVFCNGELVEGQVRKKLVDRVKEHRVMQYMSEKMANKQLAVMTADTNAEQLQVTKVEFLSGRREEAMRQLKSSWFMPGLVRSMLSDTQGAGERVLGIKILCGILATEASAAHRGKGGQSWPCRLCQSTEDGRETNFHVLWRCNHCDAVVECRNEMAAKVWKILDHHKICQEDKVMAAAIVALQDGKAMWNKVKTLSRWDKSKG